MAAQVQDINAKRTNLDHITLLDKLGCGGVGGIDPKMGRTPTCRSQFRRFILMGQDGRSCHILEFFISAHMVPVGVGIDDVFYLQTFLLKDIQDVLNASARIKDCSFFCLFICYDIAIDH